MNYEICPKIRITGGFWKRRQEINRKITIGSVWNRFVETGRIDAFRCDWKEGQPNRPHIYWDSDVAKWIEAAAYLIAEEPCSALQEKIEWLIDRIEENQWKDGYFNLYYTVCEPGKRFTERSNHELYCAGHLIEAAVAYFEATGRDRFLHCMMRYADCIERIFVKERSAAFETPGHEEIELALIRLYRCTGEKRYLDLCAFFLNRRGVSDKEKHGLYMQDHLPVREQTEAEGHAVRALYLYSGMADLARETEDQALLTACKTLFRDITERKMYLTGGSGSTHIGEAFTVGYDLPNATAYAETCAAIALVFFCRRLQRLETDSIYGDILERALYNGVLSGISLDGKAFFYENPLEIRLLDHTKYRSTKESARLPITQRKEIFDCSCCPPNINRLIASLPDYIYDYSKGALFVHQFMESEAIFGSSFVHQTTDYPNSGKVRLETRGIDVLMIRIPGWCRRWDTNASYTMQNGYARIENPPSVLEVSFEMTPTLMQANAHVRADLGKAALQFGPLVYCAEGIDNGGSLDALYLNRDLSATIQYDDRFCASVIDTAGWRKQAAHVLYQPLEDGEAFGQCSIRFIPYFGFANRGESDMSVWLPVR